MSDPVEIANQVLERHKKLWDEGLETNSYCSVCVSEAFPCNAVVLAGAVLQAQTAMHTLDQKLGEAQQRINSLEVERDRAISGARDYRNEIAQAERESYRMGYDEGLERSSDY